MSNRVLIAFGTMSGSTREVAVAIGDELRKGGLDVDVVKANDVRKTIEYSAIIIGTPVMGGLLNGACKRVLRRNRKDLVTKKVALFIMCGALVDPTDKNKSMAEGYMTKLLNAAPEVKPIDTAIFAGGLKSEGLDFEKANPFKKMIIRKLALEFKDGRDFDKIRAWAKKLTEMFQ